MNYIYQDLSFLVHQQRTRKVNTALGKATCNIEIFDVVVTQITRHKLANQKIGIRTVYES